ncbi:MAG TPA: DUF6166 domain-containing protein [Solirubrobacterales bacterium]
MLTTTTETTATALVEMQGEPAYVGEWTTIGRTVVVEQGGNRELLAMQPAQIGGYAWGRAGVLPREVARAILLDATDNPMLAERLCRPLTWEVISTLPAEGFRLTRAEVLAWVEGREPEAASPAQLASALNL